MKHYRSLWLLGALLAVAATFDSCSCGNKCNGVTCPEFTACDSSNGLCMCGGINGDGGANAVACGANERCDGTVLSCVSTLCDSVLCTSGETCDPADGTCKCGGTPCQTGELCDGLTHQCLSSPLCQGIACSAGQSCDPRTGACACGNATCADGDLCVDGGCSVDPCFGVSCSGANNGCFDGICRCGSATGPSCNEEQFCDGMACRESSICAGVSCEPGTVCGALDGFCHCGGTTGPVCRGGATCVLYLPDSGLPSPLGTDGGTLIAPSGSFVGRCLGGDLCAGVNCSPGEVCDPTSGTCLCGSFDAGTAPVKCNPSEFCGPAPSGAVQCLTLCDPYGAPCPPVSPPPDGGISVPIPQACYYETSLDQLLCETAGTGSEGDSCEVQTDCPLGETCAQPPSALGDAGAVPSCRQFCNTFDGGTLGCNVEDRQCFPITLIPVDGGQIAVGSCWPPLLDAGLGEF